MFERSLPSWSLCRSAFERFLAFADSDDVNLAPTLFLGDKLFSQENRKNFAEFVFNNVTFFVISCMNRSIFRTPGREK